MTNSDELLQAALVGDPQAREVVGSRLLIDLRVFFARCIHDSDYVNDLVQESMIVVWNRGPEKAPREAAKFASWVRGVAVVTAMATRRKQHTEWGRRVSIQCELSQKTPPLTPSSMLIEAETMSRVEQCIAQLSTPHRDVVRHVRNGGSFKALAAARGIPEKTLRARYDSAVKRIQRMLERDG